MTGLRTCFLFAQIALVVGASAWSLARLTALRRQAGAYGLSDAIGAGVIGGLIGMAAGGALCVLLHDTSLSGGNLVAWATRLLPFGGLAIIEGAAVGTAMAFGLDRLTRRPNATPPVDPDA